jgi:hypothetical protein
MFRRSRQKEHESEEQHKVVDDRLTSAEDDLEQHARRLRLLELEVGIYKPPLRGVQTDR